MSTGYSGNAASRVTAVRRHRACHRRARRRLPPTTSGQHWTATIATARPISRARSHYTPGMEIRQLQSFVAIARRGGFRRAADELNISQAALSQQMKQLESEAQVALFERGHRPLTLTEAGQALLDHAERILSEANSA